MSSSDNVSEPGEKRLLTSNILRDVSVRISKVSEYDLAQPHKNANVVKPKATSNSLKSNVAREIANAEDMSLALNLCPVVTENEVDTVPLGDGCTNLVEYNPIDKKESYTNQFTQEKIALDAMECDLGAMDRLATKDLKQNSAKVKDLNLIPGEIGSYENSMHTDEQCTTSIKKSPDPNQTCNITKTTQSILTCQIASPDSVDPIIGWLPSSQQNINDPINFRTGSWKQAKTIIQVKSQSACSNSANSTRSVMHSDNVSCLSPKYQGILETMDIEYEVHKPSINASSTESNDSDCVVEYISKDERISTNETVVSTKKAKLAESDINKMYALRRNEKINNKRSLKTNSNFRRKREISNKLSFKTSAPCCMPNKRDVQIVQSDAEEFSDNEASTSENEDVIDADEIKTLTSELRRSSRVARPVYDPFIDQQVTDETLLETLNRSDRKFSQTNDDDITDSEGGNDSDFEPKVKETKRRKVTDDSEKSILELNKIKKSSTDGGIKVKIKNWSRKTSSNRSQSPPPCTAPKRKRHISVCGSANPKKCNQKFISKRSIDSARMVPITKCTENLEQSRKLADLQRKMNKMLEYLADPIPTILRRVGTTFITSDRTYHASVGVLLKFLMQAAIYEIPSRTTPVMDDVDSFRQGGLVFVHRKLNNADAANIDWWKDGVKYLSEPKTFMKPIQNSGGQNIMQQIDLAQEERLERVAVWTTINPELVAVNYRIIPKASSDVITIYDVDIEEPANVIDNIQSSSHITTENRLSQCESIKAPPNNAVSSLYCDKSQSKSIENPQIQKDRNVNPFLPTQISQEFPFNSSSTFSSPAVENEGVSQQTSTNYLSNKQKNKECITPEIQLDNTFYISSGDDDDSNEVDPGNSENIKRMADPNQLKIRDINEVDENYRVMQCRPMLQLMQQQSSMRKESMKSIARKSNITHINQFNVSSTQIPLNKGILPLSTDQSISCKSTEEIRQSYSVGYNTAMGNSHKRKVITTPKRPVSEHPLRQNQYKMAASKALKFHPDSSQSFGNNLETVIDLKPDIIEDIECKIIEDGNVSLRDPISPSLPDHHSICQVNPMEKSNPYLPNSSVPKSTVSNSPEIEKIIDISSDEEGNTNS